MKIKKKEIGEKYLEVIVELTQREWLHEEKKYFRIGEIQSSLVKEYGDLILKESSSPYLDNFRINNQKGCWLFEKKPAPPPSRRGRPKKSTVPQKGNKNLTRKSIRARIKGINESKKEK